MVEHIRRQTKQKDAIRAALADCEEFISAQDLHRRLEGRRLENRLSHRIPPAQRLGRYRVPPTRSAWMASSCSAYAATADITTTWCAGGAGQNRGNRPAQRGVRPRKVADGHGFIVESHTFGGLPDCALICQRAEAQKVQKQ